MRADLYSSTPTAFTYVIKVNGVVKATYYDTVLAYTTARTVQSFSTQNACKIQITYTGYVSPVYIYAPGVDVTGSGFFASDTTSNNPKTLTANLNVAGNWYFVIAHGITSNAYNLIPFTLDIKTFT